MTVKFTDRILLPLAFWSVAFTVKFTVCVVRIDVEPSTNAGISGGTLSPIVKVDEFCQSELEKFQCVLAEKITVSLGDKFPLSSAVLLIAVAMSSLFLNHVVSLKDSAVESLPALVEVKIPDRPVTLAGEGLMLRLFMTGRAQALDWQEPLLVVTFIEVAPLQQNLLEQALA